MSSKRLPGKVLLDIGGKPMLHRVWDALEAPAWTRVILTSTQPSDDPIAEYAIEHGLLHKGGPLEDVLLRYVGFMQHAKPAIMVRVCGDAPFLKKAWVFQALECVEKHDEPVFVPGALHAGTFADWLECLEETPNWHPDREHAGHDWFREHGRTIDLVPESYFTVNTAEDLVLARALWTEKHPEPA